MPEKAEVAIEKTPLQKTFGILKNIEAWIKRPTLNKSHLAELNQRGKKKSLYFEKAQHLSVLQNISYTTQKRSELAGITLSVEEIEALQNKINELKEAVNKVTPEELKLNIN